MTDRRIEPYNIVRVTAYSESGERLSDSIDYVGYYKWYNKTLNRMFAQFVSGVDWNEIKRVSNK